MARNRVSFLDVPLDLDGNIDAIGKLWQEKKSSQLVTFVGPKAWLLARQDPAYKEALEQMSMVLPDGAGITGALWFMRHQKIRPSRFDMGSIAGPFFEAAAKAKLSMVLIGGKPSDDEDVHAKLMSRYPTLNIVATTHSFGEFAPKISIILEKKPRIVLVGMGAPRQEEFLLALKKAGYKGLAIACDDFFPHYMDIDYADGQPQWVSDWNLRYLYQFAKEPGRLWRRYAFDYPVFFALLLWSLVGPLVKKGVPRTGKTAGNTAKS